MTGMSERSELNSPSELMSVDRSDAGDSPTFTVNLLLVFQHLVEGDKAHAIAALVQAVVTEAADLDAEHAALFAGTDALTGDAIADHLAESSASGVGADHRQGFASMDRGIQP